MAKRRTRPVEIKPCAYHDPMGKPCVCIRPAVTEHDVLMRQRSQATADAWQSGTFREHLKAIRAYMEADKRLKNES